MHQSIKRENFTEIEMYYDFWQLGNGAPNVDTPKLKCC